MKQQGGAALGMVLLMLLPGVSLLHITRQQLEASLTLVADERRHIIDFHQALSALAWGEQLHWQPVTGWQCQRERRYQWQACLLRQDEKKALLQAASVSDESDALTLWQWMQPEDDTHWRAAPHGWLDFCPLRDSPACHPEQQNEK